MAAPVALDSKTILDLDPEKQKKIEAIKKTPFFQDARNVYRLPQSIFSDPAELAKLDSTVQAEKKEKEEKQLKDFRGILDDDSKTPVQKATACFQLFNKVYGFTHIPVPDDKDEYLKSFDQPENAALLQAVNRKEREKIIKGNEKAAFDRMWQQYLEIVKKNVQKQVENLVETLGIADEKEKNIAKAHLNAQITPSNNKINPQGVAPVSATVSRYDNTGNLIEQSKLAYLGGGKYGLVASMHWWDSTHLIFPKNKAAAIANHFLDQAVRLDGVVDEVKSANIQQGARVTAGIILVTGENIKFSPESPGGKWDSHGVTDLLNRGPQYYVEKSVIDAAKQMWNEQVRLKADEWAKDFSIPPDVLEALGGDASKASDDQKAEGEKRFLELADHSFDVALRKDPVWVAQVIQQLSIGELCKYQAMPDYVHLQKLIKDYQKISQDPAFDKDAPPELMHDDDDDDALDKSSSKAFSVYVEKANLEKEIISHFGWDPTVAKDELGKIRNDTMGGAHLQKQLQEYFNKRRHFFHEKFSTSKMGKQIKQLNLLYYADYNVHEESKNKESVPLSSKYNTDPSAPKTAAPTSTPAPKAR